MFGPAPPQYSSCHLPYLAQLGQSLAIFGSTAPQYGRLPPLPSVKPPPPRPPPFPNHTHQHAPIFPSPLPLPRSLTPASLIYPHPQTWQVHTLGKDGHAAYPHYFGANATLPLGAALTGQHILLSLGAYTTTTVMDLRFDPSPYRTVSGKLRPLSFHPSFPPAPSCSLHFLATQCAMRRVRR